MQPRTPRFNEWLVAEKDAIEIERRLHRAMLASSQGGVSLDASLVVLARAKRAKAHCMLDEAMQEMKTLAESLHHRHIGSRPPSSNDEDSARHQA